MAPRLRADSSAAVTSGSPPGGPNPITMSSRLNNGVQPGAKSGGEIESRQGALADDHRVNEFHRDVLRVGRQGTASERQQTAAPEGSALPSPGTPAPGGQPRGRRSLRTDGCAPGAVLRSEWQDASCELTSIYPNAGIFHRRIRLQQILGNGSPTSMSTTRLPPKPVVTSTVAAGS